MSKLFVGCLLILCMVFPSNSSAAMGSSERITTRDPIAKVLPITRPMKPLELVEVYKGKTWVWKQGGAYYSPSFNRYVAVGSDGYGRGRWSLPGFGVLCETGVWNNLAQNKTAQFRNCYAHRIDRLGRIYRRKNPDGPWYFMRTYPGSSKDLINDFVEGDKVSPQLEKKISDSD